MDKQTALEYIASGQEAMRKPSAKANYGHTPVILRGYGYTTTSKYNPKPVQHSGATGVLCDVLDFNGKPVGQRVYPLRALFATTVAEFREAHAEEQRIRESARRTLRETQETDKARAAVAIGVLEVGTVGHSHFTGNPYVHLTIDAAEELAQRIQRLEDEISALHERNDA
jgi:hypothetical protein